MPCVNGIWSVGRRNWNEDFEMPVDERARKGLFLAMQYPAEIQGVTNAEFLRAAINARRPKDNQISVMEFLQELDEKLRLLNTSDVIVQHEGGSLR